MIYLEMYGRLGNQFFRYAAARAVQLKYYPEETLVINFAQIDKAAKTDSTFYDVLSDFNAHSYEKYAGGQATIQREQLEAENCPYPLLPWTA